MECMLGRIQFQNVIICDFFVIRKKADARVRDERWRNGCSRSGRSAVIALGGCAGRLSRFFHFADRSMRAAMYLLFFIQHTSVCNDCILYIRFFSLHSSVIFSMFTQIRAYPFHTQTYIIIYTHVYIALYESTQLFIIAYASGLERHLEI